MISQHSTLDSGRDESGQTLSEGTARYADLESDVNGQGTYKLYKRPVGHLQALGVQGAFLHLQKV